MINNIIRVEDKVYVVRRILNPSTTEESAYKIHGNLGTDALLRNSEGKWFCCKSVIDVEYRDITDETPKLEQGNSPEDYSHTSFELQDHGGLG